MHDKRLCPAVLALSLSLGTMASVHAQSLTAPDLSGPEHSGEPATTRGDGQTHEKATAAASTEESAAQSPSEAHSEVHLPSELNRPDRRPTGDSVNEALMEELGFTQDLDLAERQTLLRRATQTEELRLALDKVFYERQKLKQDNAMEAMREQHEEDIQAVRNKLSSRLQAVRDHYRSEVEKIEVQVEALREAVAERAESKAPFLTRITMYNDEYHGSFFVDGQVKQAATGDRLSEHLTVMAISKNGATVRTEESEEIFLAPVPLDYARDKVREAAEAAKRVAGLNIDYRALTIAPGPEFEWADSGATSQAARFRGAPSDQGGWPTEPDALMRN